MCNPKDLGLRACTRGGEEIECLPACLRTQRPRIVAGAPHPLLVRQESGVVLPGLRPTKVATGPRARTAASLPWRIERMVLGLHDGCSCPGMTNRKFSPSSGLRLVGFCGFSADRPTRRPEDSAHVSCNQIHPKSPRVIAAELPCLLSLSVSGPFHNPNACNVHVPQRCFDCICAHLLCRGRAARFANLGFVISQAIATLEGVGDLCPGARGGPLHFGWSSHRHKTVFCLKNFSRGPTGPRIVVRIC